MKTEIIGESTQEKEIDWDKNQLVYFDSVKNLLVLSNGHHVGATFEGVILLGKTSLRVQFDHVSDFCKNSFKLCNTSITIKFSND
jgi:hypothetical protein